MCVPIPPSTGSSTKAVGTTPTSSTTQPTIDYSRYAGMSPFDVRQTNQNGLPQGWDWNEWMKVNPTAPDPTTHTNTGQVISPQNAAQWSAHPPPPTPTAPNPGTPGIATTPTTLRNGINALLPPTTPSLAPTVTPTTPPVPTQAVVTHPSPSPTEPAPDLVAQGLPNIPQTTTTYSGSTPIGYGPGPLMGEPAGRVANAIMRRYKPDSWY